MTIDQRKVRCSSLFDRKRGKPIHKFEKLEIWQLAVEYTDLCYALAEKLPKREEYNLGSQIRRASVSIALNIAEGSTSQSDPEQARFLSMAVRSVIETVACLHLIHRRSYIDDVALMRETYRSSEKLVAKIQAMRRTILGERAVREEIEGYATETSTPFDQLEL